ncbi:hypothetical protein BH20ACT11_BH20ACT11_11700 [soil metagenome]
MRCFSPGEGLRELERGELGAALDKGGCGVWIDLLRPRDGARSILTGNLGLGTLVVEDCLSPLRMPKMDTFEGCAFVAAFAARLEREAGYRAHLRAVEVDPIVGENYLVTVRDGPVREIEDGVERRLGQASDARRNETHEGGPGERLAHAALDSLVDGHLPALVGVAAAAEELEEGLDPRNERASTSALESLILLRRDLSAFRRLAIAQQESLRRLGRWSRSLRGQLSDVVDNQREAVGMGDATRHYADGAVESYRMRRDERSEVGIRRLTVLAGIIGPMTLLAGWWGANFDSILGSGSQWGFGVFVGVQLVFAVLAVWFMIRRGLL